MPPKMKQHPFAKGFAPQSPAEAHLAIGAFPFVHPSSNPQAEHQRIHPSEFGQWRRPSTWNLVAAPDEFNDPSLYHTTT
jgi:hypothetical protein